MSEETLEPDLRRLADQLIGSTDLEPDKQDELAVALAQRRQGVAVLWHLLDELVDDNLDRSPDTTRAVVLGLTSATPLPRGLVARLVQMLDKAREPRVIAGALDGLRRTHHPDAWPHMVRYIDHPAPEVRSAALRYAAATKPTRAWGLLVSALPDKDPLVRENAVDELHELALGVRDVLPMIDALRNDDNHRVRQAAGLCSSRSPRGVVQRRPQATKRIVPFWSSALRFRRPHLFNVHRRPFAPRAQAVSDVDALTRKDDPRKSSAARSPRIPTFAWSPTTSCLGRPNGACCSSVSTLGSLVASSVLVP